VQDAAGGPGHRAAPRLMHAVTRHRTRPGAYQRQRVAGVMMSSVLSVAQLPEHLD
jgi:hypothetical protein